MDCYERGGCDSCFNGYGSFGRRIGSFSGTSGSLCRPRDSTWNTLVEPIILVLAMITRNTCHGTSPATATTLRISRTVGCSSSCHQGGENKRIASHRDSWE